MKTDADAIVEATRVLEQLIKDCETVARDSEIFRTRKKILKNITDWRKGMASENLPLNDLYGLIEGVYGDIAVAKKRIPRFDDRHPGIGKRMSKAKALVLDANKRFIDPTGIEIPVDLYL